MRVLFITLLVLCVTGCAGIRKSGNQFTAHAESFNILTLQIPGDDYDAAMKQVPAGAEVHTIQSTPSDMTSFWGLLNRIIGIGVTHVSGTVSK